MKFTCSQLSLNKAINTVSRAVSAKTTMPALKGILMTVADGKLTLTASDLDISINTFTMINDYEEGSVLVNAKLFSEIIRKLPNSLVRAEVNEKGILNISCLGSKFSIVTLPAEEYPSVSTIENGTLIKINGYLLRKLIKRTSFAASIDEKKGILVGCLLNINNGYLEMVSLDGFRLALAKEYEVFDGEANVVIPAASLDIMEKIITDNLGESGIELYIEDKKIAIKAEETEVIARLLEGDFIRYKDIIPTTYATKVTLSRTELLSSIERASLFSKEGKNNLVKFKVENGSVLVSSRSEEGNVNESIPADIEGGEITIGFNSKYLIDVLKNLDEEEISMELTSSTSATLIKPVDGDAFTYLVLPVRIIA